MHRAVGEEHPAQTVGFQPVAIEEDEAFAGLALQLQALAYNIKILAVGAFGNGSQHLIAGQQFALAVAYLRQGNGVRYAADGIWLSELTEGRTMSPGHRQSLVSDLTKMTLPA